MKTAELKDLSSFKRIKDYLYSDPQINAILIVKPDSLEKVGDLMLESDDEDDEALDQFKEWINDKTITLFEPVKDNMNEKNSLAVYVVRILPYYLISFTGKRYE